MTGLITQHTFSLYCWTCYKNYCSTILANTKEDRNQVESFLRKWDAGHAFSVLCKLEGQVSKISVCRIPNVVQIINLSPVSIEFLRTLQFFFWRNIRNFVQLTEWRKLFRHKATRDEVTHSLYISETAHFTMSRNGKTN